MFCILVVLVKLSVLAKWLARKTPLRKPNRGEGIVCRKPRPKSAHDFLGLLYCFIVLLYICVVSCPYVTYFPTVVARYSLFVLKVPLNPKQTNKQTFLRIWHTSRFCSWSFTFHLFKPPSISMLMTENFSFCPLDFDSSMPTECCLQISSLSSLLKLIFFCFCLCTLSCGRSVG